MLYMAMSVGMNSYARQWPYLKRPFCDSIKDARVSFFDLMREVSSCDEAMIYMEIVMEQMIKWTPLQHCRENTFQNIHIWPFLFDTY